MYSELLMQKINKTGTKVYLVNTGWTGGAYGKGGERFSIPVTRAIINAIQTGAFSHDDAVKIPGFNFLVPKHLPDIDPQLLQPQNNWDDQASYKEYANRLINEFHSNFERFEVAAAVRDAGPGEI